MKKLIKKYNIKVAQNFNDQSYTLEYLLNQKETNQDNIEGWIITFEDGQMAKIKTNKYLSLHGLIGPDVFRENLLIQSILNSTIDDVIAALISSPKKDKIIDLDKKIVNYFNYLVVNTINTLKNNTKLSRKEFAIKFKNSIIFGNLMKLYGYSINEDIVKKLTKDLILRKTKSLSDAKTFILSI